MLVTVHGSDTKYVLPWQALTDGLMDGFTDGSILHQRCFCCRYKLQEKKHRTCTCFPVAGVDGWIDGWFYGWVLERWKWTNVLQDSWQALTDGLTDGFMDGSSSDGNGPPPDNYQYATGNSHLELVQTLLIQ